jgi:hypothetical protein
MVDDRCAGIGLTHDAKRPSPIIYYPDEGEM